MPGCTQQVDASLQHVEAVHGLCSLDVTWSIIVWTLDNTLSPLLLDVENGSDEMLTIILARDEGEFLIVGEIMGSHGVGVLE